VGRGRGGIGMSDSCDRGAGVSTWCWMRSGLPARELPVMAATLVIGAEEERDGARESWRCGARVGG